MWKKEKLHCLIRIHVVPRVTFRTLSAQGQRRMTLPKTLKLTAAAILVFAGAVNTFADVRIRFAKGRTSATVSGKVSTGGRVCYMAGARSGQTFTATVSSRSGNVQIFESGETSYSYQVEVSGDQSVCVDNIGRATTYSLTVSIK